MSLTENKNDGLKRRKEMANATIKIVKITGQAISNREARLVVNGKVVARSDFEATSSMGRAAALDKMYAAAEKRGLQPTLAE